MPWPPRGRSLPVGSALRSVPSPTTPVFRVARGIDPFAPNAWERAGDDGTFGNRFDDPGASRGIPESERFRTIYCATDRAGAFGEVVARFRPSPRTLAELESIEDCESLPDILRGIVDPNDPYRGLVTSEWQLRRRVGHAYLDPALRFVDIADAENMNLLRRELATLLTELTIAEIDVSAVTSQHRRLTQEIARYIFEQVDEAGRPCFAGIRYPSRLNPDWECWAVFDTRMIHRPGPSETVRPDDPGLIEAARIFHLTIEGPVKGHYIRP